jgi:hypothetical protein
MKFRIAERRFGYAVAVRYGKLPEEESQLRDANVSFALKQLHNYGNTIVHINITPEQDKRLLTILAARRDCKVVPRTSNIN